MIREDTAGVEFTRHFRSLVTVMLEFFVVIRDALLALLLAWSGVDAAQHRQPQKTQDAEQTTTAPQPPTPPALHP